jgi:hypothetical protein
MIEGFSTVTVATLCLCAVLILSSAVILARAIIDEVTHAKLRRDYMRWRQQCRMADEWYVCCNEDDETDTEKEG